MVRVRCAAWRVTETMYTTMGGETCANVTRSGCYAKDGGAALTELARTTSTPRSPVFFMR